MEYGFKHIETTVLLNSKCKHEIKCYENVYCNGTQCPSWKTCSTVKDLRVEYDMDLLKIEYKYL